MEAITFINVDASNVEETGVVCIKNKKAPGYRAKVNWFKQKCNEGLKIQIAQDEDENQLGFIEYIPSEQAWRPIQADNYLFIHCIATYAKKSRQQGIGSSLIDICEREAREQNKSGICVMASKGAWIAEKTLFEKNGFVIVDKKGRFELLVKKIDKESPDPKFIDWETNLSIYQGWHILYADQCPWHEKSVNDLLNAAMDFDIDLKVTQLTTPEEAQNAPTGYGTFALIYNGKLLEDHYISITRFLNILKKEMG